MNLYTQHIAVAGIGSQRVVGLLSPTVGEDFSANDPCYEEDTLLTHPLAIAASATPTVSMRIRRSRAYSA